MAWQQKFGFLLDRIQLGHFSAGFTLDTYAHVTTSAQKEAANTMGGVLRVAANS